MINNRTRSIRYKRYSMTLADRWPDPSVRVSVDKSYRRTDIGGSMDGVTLRARVPRDPRYGKHGPFGGQKSSIGYRTALPYHPADEVILGQLSSYQTAINSFFDAPHPGAEILFGPLRTQMVDE